MPSSQRALSARALRFLAIPLHGQHPRPTAALPTAARAPAVPPQRSHSTTRQPARPPSTRAPAAPPGAPRRRRQSTFSAAAAAAHAAALVADPARALALDPYALFPQALPLGAPPRGPFAVDARALRREFLALQARAHPDVAAAGPRPPGGEGAGAGALAARINEAYATLRDPLRRARLVLRSRGELAEEEATMVQDEGLLAEVMEAREEAERVAGDEEAEGRLRAENRARMEEVTDALARAFARDDLAEARALCVRLKYWQGVEEVLRHGAVMH
jgi:molecular chaperone HscB